jgi:hypothetical protein|tara:strand:+ start:552 stop:743 length:192 start_codon:yes stop_codon:yes gene_type:complete
MKSIVELINKVSDMVFKNTDEILAIRYQNLELLKILTDKNIINQVETRTIIDAREQKDQVVNG